MKSTNDVLDRHLKAIEQGDVKAVLSDYAPDAVLFRRDGVFNGVGAIRPVFEEFVAQFQKPGTTISTKRRCAAFRTPRQIEGAKNERHDD